MVGVDQEWTSKETLEHLMKLKVETRVFYPNSSSIVFHPKVYVFEGKKKARIIVGSSNLTMQGLFDNVEVAIQVDFLKPDEEGERLLAQITNYLQCYFEDEAANSQKLTSKLIKVPANLRSGRIML